MGQQTSDGVHIECTADKETVCRFYKSLVNNPPKLSRITGWDLQETTYTPFEDFRIIHSDSHGQPSLLLTPDFTTCTSCRMELFDDTNRRRGYTFITCTYCGPRGIRQLR